jgi:hypothetical protein
MYLSKATDDDIFLFMAADIYDAIESCCKTSCGYTSVNKIRNKKNLIEKIFLVKKCKRSSFG